MTCPIGLQICTHLNTSCAPAVCEMDALTAQPTNQCTTMSCTHVANTFGTCIFMVIHRHSMYKAVSSSALPSKGSTFWSLLLSFKCQPPRHLLSTRWSTFVNKKFVSRDTGLFLRSTWSASTRSAPQQPS